MKPEAFTPIPFSKKQLVELATSASICRRCGLSERRRNVVFGEGNDSSPLMIVGEGPGDTEDQSGRPFVGRAGQLLIRALEECGLSRNDVFIANTVKCRAADWSTGKPVNRPPTPSETLACRPWLLEQIQIIKPKVILCVGSPSAKNLISKDFKITQDRGRVFQSEFACAIIATLHPSYILRLASQTSDGGYGLFVSDIKKSWEMAVRLQEVGKLSPLEVLN